MLTLRRYFENVRKKHAFSCKSKFREKKRRRSCDGSTQDIEFCVLLSCTKIQKMKRSRKCDLIAFVPYGLRWKRTNFPFNVVRTRAPKTNFRIKGPLLDPRKFFQGFIQARQSDSRSVPSAVLLIAPVFVGFTFAVIARRYVHFGPIFTDRAQQGWWADIIPAIRFLNFGRGNEGE